MNLSKLINICPLNNQGFAMISGGGDRSRVQFNNARYIFYDFSSSFYEPYISRKHIFHESYRVNKTQDYVQVPNFWHCHNFKNIFIGNFQHHPFLLIEQKFCKEHFSQSRR